MKNIIICSDGTGNAGGTKYNTNVFKLYKAIDIDTTDNQYIYYDDGIGSIGNNYIKLISGTFGFGFKKNILKIYKYIVTHYKPGDKIFLFGFSRGAATVRGVAGMIQDLGLLRSDSKLVTTDGKSDDIKLRIEIYKLMRLYQRKKRYRKEIEKFKTEHTYGPVDIEMIGVWDTVSALGFPEDSTWLIIMMSRFIDRVSDLIIPHRYFNFQLDRNVKNAYHALAIDDDRHTFHPKVWNETLANRPINIEQVWFAGAHANVGGGYPRSGLAAITLDWMITRAKLHGIQFNEDIIKVNKSVMNHGGKLFDPRAGLKVYYRFSPRHITNLCSHKKKSILTGNIKIHKSVIERIRTREYAPILPNKFEIVETYPTIIPKVYEEKIENVKNLKKRANAFHKIKIVTYRLLTEASFLAGIMVLYLNSNMILPEVTSKVYAFILTITPSFAESFMYYCIYINPFFGFIFFLIISSAYILHKLMTLFADRVRKQINWYLLDK